MLTALRDEFEDFRHRITSMEQAMKRIAPNTLEAASEPIKEELERPDSASSAPVGVEDGESSSLGEAASTQAPIGSLEARTITRNMEEEKEVDPGPLVPPGVPSIPPNHTTLAAFLLQWPAIQALVGDILDEENVKYINEFPIRQEERRGLLRIWGRGEGFDNTKNTERSDREALRDTGYMEVQDDASDAGAPSPMDSWGLISGSPGPIDGKPVTTNSTGPDFTESIVWKYVRSYEENIQNMHPLIMPKELHAMVRVFLDSIQHAPRQKSGSAAPVAKFVLNRPETAEVGTKRKRSPPPESSDTPSSSPKTKPTFQRSINNALVLLILALGKICLYKDRIPDIVPASDVSHGSPMARNGYPASPVQSSSPSYSSHSAGLPSPKEGSAERPSLSRRASFQGTGTGVKPIHVKRNMDVIPGLDYFAYATDILGGQLAGTSLRHIWAHLLAGLYHGQLGRVLESYAYIKEAGHALQMKLRP